MLDIIEPVVMLNFLDELKVLLLGHINLIPQMAFISKVTKKIMSCKKLQAMNNFHLLIIFKWKWRQDVAFES